MVVVATKKSQRCVKMFLPSLATTSCKAVSTDKHWIRIVSSSSKLKSLWRLFGWNFGLGTTKPAPQKEDSQQVLPPLFQTDVVRLLASCPAHSPCNLGGEFKTRIDDRDDLLEVNQCSCREHFSKRSNTEHCIVNELRML